MPFLLSGGIFFAFCKVFFTWVLWKFLQLKILFHLIHASHEFVQKSPIERLEEKNRIEFLAILCSLENESIIL